MNRALVDPIADAVLYEGYILYPYRPSVKNRQRWTFGGLYPEDYCRSDDRGDAPSSQTECLIHGTPSTTFEAAVRFLHLTARQVGEFVPPLSAWPGGAGPPYRPVETLRVGDRLFQTWQEAEPREVVPGEVALGELAARPRVTPFTFPGGRRSEPVFGTAGEVVGVLAREQEAVEGVVEVSAVEVAGGLFRLTLHVVNRTPIAEAGRVSRDEALLRALVSTHAVLGVGRGEFVSLLDPPECWREAASACRNVGTWPVLVGEEGRKDMMLSSPIILYDYPRVAPESPGDFFDGTEIDEMLTLRIMTLTDGEKSAMAALDDRAGALLARTEASAREQLLGLHGTIRGLRPLPGEHANG
jgi:hydrogenase maturation protease